MMVYAESSGVLAWLLGDETGAEAGEALAMADGVVASDLTAVECERVLIRAWSTGLLSEADRIDQSSALARVAAHWVRLRVDVEVIERATRAFPIEPVRTLGALHLASALLARSVAPETRLLSLDRRIRDNGARLGLEVVP